MRVILTRREPLDSADGVNIFIVALAQALSDQNHEVWIVVGALGSELQFRRLHSPRLDLNVTVLSDTPLQGAASLAAWLRGKRIIDRLKPDLIINNEAIPFPFAATTVHVVHDLEPRPGALAPVWRSIRRYSMRRSNHVVATTTELQLAVLKEIGVSPDRVKIIPKCVDLSLYNSRGFVERERAILHSGTDLYKNPAATIGAFGLMADPTITLYLEGEITESVRIALQALPSHIRDRAIPLGKLDGVARRRLYRRVRVASFPTQYRGPPVASATVMESIASGTPIVGSSRVSRDVLAHGTNGLVVPSETPQCEFALRLGEIINDDALWTKLSTGALRVASRFSAPIIADRYIELAKQPLMVSAVSGAPFNLPS